MLLQGLYRRALFMKVVLPIGGSIGLVCLTLVHRFMASNPPALTERRIMQLLFMAVMGYLIGAGLFLLYRTKLLRRKLRKGGLTCLGCGYPLRTLPRAGQCPECGRHYVRTEVTQTWRELAGGRPRNRQRCHESSLKTA